MSQNKHLREKKFQTKIDQKTSHEEGGDLTTDMIVDHHVQLLEEEGGIDLTEKLMTQMLEKMGLVPLDKTEGLMAEDVVEAEVEEVFRINLF